MSWEKTRHRDYKCPCRQSTYSVTILTDDWNQSDERWTMNCMTCKKNYAIHSFWENDSGLSFEVKYWIKKEILTSLEDNENHHKNLMDGAMEYAKKRYLNQWLGVFQNIRSKKQIWDVLGSLFSNQPSLSAFYTHVKNEGIDAYLTREFNFQNLENLLLHLKVEDSNMIEQLFKAKNQQSEVLQIKKTLIKNRFR